MNPLATTPIPFPSINLIPAYPEVVLLIAGSAILLMDMFFSDRRLA